MPDITVIEEWPPIIRDRYKDYLMASFFFSNKDLRESFKKALEEEKALLEGPFREKGRKFEPSLSAEELAEKCFPGESGELCPALLKGNLYIHQKQAICATHIEKKNIVVATGTASGKTESFLYPILFELYSQYKTGDLNKQGVRALILYPMNALANDQRERLGEICKRLEDGESGFRPTFGQYIGQTPESAARRMGRSSVSEEGRLPGELIYREEMRENPPHILLTNYSMLEYLLIRPDDSPLFDGGRGKHWQFIVLDEAHQYRGARGMEMGMLIRRLKQRLREGGRDSDLRCIATSATMSSSESQKDKKIVAEFAKELFGENFTEDTVFFSKFDPKADESPRRYHAFLRALEGAFLIHQNGKDKVILNRKSYGENVKPLEIALCGECGQHYYVGQNREGMLQEAIRDPSHDGFGVEFYLPLTKGDEQSGNETGFLCRCCGAMPDSNSDMRCSCNATIPVKKCEQHKDHPDQIKECGTCGYQRGGIGDPVREIVHGSDGPNTVIATALHELLPEGKRKVLAFADSRQQAAFFAWYAENSYKKLRDRNLILRAVKMERSTEGLSINDLKNRLLKQREKIGLFLDSDTEESKDVEVAASVLSEAVTSEKRLSLSGVGLVRWSVRLPDDLKIPDVLHQAPWNLEQDEARRLVMFLLDELRQRRAVSLTNGSGRGPNWNKISTWPQQSYGIGRPGGRRNVRQWDSKESVIVKHYLYRLLDGSDIPHDKKIRQSVELMGEIWKSLPKRRPNDVLSRAREGNTFYLNQNWIRINLAEPENIWECDTCSNLMSHNIRGICSRNRCPGTLKEAEQSRLAENHYRKLYENRKFPPVLIADEHTAQINTNEARDRQDRFKKNEINLLSSSTTFEVGVDLGDLDVVFLRNVPPEPFNYVQRVGRAGRRGTPGLAVTYCRRNPHDLYHYEDPERRILDGAVHPPKIKMTNQRIILRHMTATVLSYFFRTKKDRFKKVSDFIGKNTRAAKDVEAFCTNNDVIVRALKEIVPDDIQERMEIDDEGWIDKICGSDSRLHLAELSVREDLEVLTRLRKSHIEKEMDHKLPSIRNRINTIKDEATLNFLSRKAVIPKYGFPVDVVELETRRPDGKPTGVDLQRDLSQAIAEYAPGGKVVANKLEWESYGIKTVKGKACKVFYYHYEDQSNFEQWEEGHPKLPEDVRQKYLIPEFGFVTASSNPKEPRGWSGRLYTTRPFFCGFEDDKEPESVGIQGISLTKVSPGTLVVLCEGKKQSGFHICGMCGAHMAELRSRHKSPLGIACEGTLKCFSLGHELVTDVVRLKLPGLKNAWEAYSVGYAILLGAADALGVPNTDLNVTIAMVKSSDEIAVVLYDNVPGGAGLVGQLEQDGTFKRMLHGALLRVRGDCGCDSSCYGCLRSYRNQFAHTRLMRERAHEILKDFVA